MSTAQVKQFYETSYKDLGFGAQRQWPNEDLMRFFGVTYAATPEEKRKDIRILEVGSGIGANIWAVARQGFDVHGVELSEIAVELSKKMLKRWNTTATVQQGDMTQLSYEDGFFDVVYDVYSVSCLDETGFKRFLKEMTRVLKPGGKYYSFHPSKNSDAWHNHAPAKKIDGSTLDSIKREGSPLCGYNSSLRFIYPEEYAQALEALGFTVTQLEKIGRTYGRMKEYYEMVSIVGQKQ